MNPIRNSVKAIIIRDGHVLLTKNEDKDGFFYLFPGGGQNAGEDMRTALRRECLEEIGVLVSVGGLRWVRDYIAQNHEFAQFDGDVHQVELYFECTIESDSEPSNGTGKDTNQVSVEWVALDRLDTVKVYPKIFQKGLDQFDAIYLGDIN
jgi:8-oxo-dGTP pyrophosphatase MutT (NUDIX family)